MLPLNIVAFDPSIVGNDDEKAARSRHFRTAPFAICVLCEAFFYEVAGSTPEAVSDKSRGHGCAARPNGSFLIDTSNEENQQIVLFAAESVNPISTYKALMVR